MAYLKDLGIHLLQEGGKEVDLVIPSDRAVLVSYSVSKCLIDVSFLTNWQDEDYLTTLLVRFAGTKKGAVRYVEELRGLSFPAVLPSVLPEDLRRVESLPSPLGCIPFFVCPILLPPPQPSPEELKAEAKRQRRAQKRLAVAHG